MNSDFSRQNLRLERARQLKNCLLAEITEWKRLNPWFLNPHLSEDKHSCIFILNITSNPNIESWDLQFGEIINHYRSTLDNLILSIAKNQGITDNQKLRRLCFPFSAKEKDWNNHHENLFVGFSNEIVEEIKKLQPFSGFGNNKFGGKNILSILQEMSNQDKHHAQLSLDKKIRESVTNLEIEFRNEIDAQISAPPELLILSSDFNDKEQLFQLKAKAPILRVSGNLEANFVLFIDYNNDCYDMFFLLEVIDLSINVIFDRLLLREDSSVNKLRILKRG